MIPKQQNEPKRVHMTHRLPLSEARCKAAFTVGSSPWDAVYGFLATKKEQKSWILGPQVVHLKGCPCSATLEIHGFDDDLLCVPHGFPVPWWILGIQSHPAATHPE